MNTAAAKRGVAYINTECVMNIIGSVITLQSCFYCKSFYQHKTTPNNLVYPYMATFTVCHCYASFVGL